MVRHADLAIFIFLGLDTNANKAKEIWQLVYRGGPEKSDSAISGFPA